MFVFRNLIFFLMVMQLMGSAFSQNENFTICSTIADQEVPRIVQGQDNWLFSKTELVTDIDINDQAIERLKELKTALDYLGIEIVFVNLPTRAMMHYDKFDSQEKLLKDYDLLEAENAYNSSLQILNALGFYAPNVLEYLNLNFEGDYGFKRDSHWTPDAAKHTSELVHNSFRESSSYGSINQGDFEIQLKETIQRNSDLARYVMVNCGNDIAKEPQNIYQVVSSKSQSDLFADSNISFIPLWGTSYSQSSNFAEFLAAELDVEIVNYGFGYAGLWRSLRNYFLEVDESKVYPEFVIWEFAYGYFEEFNLLDIYKEIIPTIYGICEGSLQASSKRLHKFITSKNLLSVADARANFANWQSMRSNATSYQTPEADEAIKLVFSGEKDPFLYHDFETNSILTNKTYEFSVLLWTDSDQPKSAALYLYAKGDVSVEPVILTNTPTLHTIKHQFSNTNDTAFTIRIDGLQNQTVTMNSENKGSFLYASLPNLSQVSAIKLIDDLNEDVQGSDYYTHITFDDQSILEYSLVYEYSDGSIYVEKINRDKHSRNNGQYFYELPDKIMSLNAISLAGISQGVRGGFSTQVCRKP